MHRSQVALSIAQTGQVRILCDAPIGDSDTESGDSMTIAPADAWMRNGWTKMQYSHYSI